MDTYKLIEQLSHGAEPVKPVRHPYAQCALWLAGLVVYMTVVLLCIHTRSDVLAKLRSPLFFAETASLALVVITSALSAALLSYPDLMQKKPLAYAPLVAFALFLASVAVAWHADTPPAPPPEHEMMCTLCMALYALAPAIWLFTTMRKAATTHAKLAGVTAALCAFSIGGLTLRLAEETDSISHIVTWHYAPMLALSLAGVWLGKAILKW